MSIDKFETFKDVNGNDRTMRRVVVRNWKLERVTMKVVNALTSRHAIEKSKIDDDARDVIAKMYHAKCDVRDMIVYAHAYIARRDAKNERNAKRAQRALIASNVASNVRDENATFIVDDVNAS